VKKAVFAPIAAILAFTLGFAASGNERNGGAEARLALLMPIPAGAVAAGALDVGYDAAPSGGAEITRVAYSINGGSWEYVYLKGGYGVSQKGTLGVARVMLAPGENSIVFGTMDSAGNTATYTVPETLVFDFGSTPDRALASLAPSSTRASTRYVTDQIVAVARNGATDAQVAHAALSIGGSIAAQVSPAGMYWLRVPGGAEVYLKALCNNLLAGYPSIFAAASLDTLRPMRVPALVADGSSGVQAAAAPTNDPWWDSYEWGLTAMNVPDVWEAYAGKLHDTKVGVVDDGFRVTHDDLQLPAGNVHNRNVADKNHGSHVIGTIGAVHNNAKGLAGVMDAARASLYGYDAFAEEDWAYDSDVLAGLAWTVANGAKAVNFSLGDTDFPYDPETDEIYSAAMQNLLDQGYDFVVVHAAGNDAQDAILGGCFAHVSAPSLRQRIISVGAMDSEYGGYELAWFTNYGSLIDVVAPGVDILSSVAYSNSSYAYYGGTSMAAPHITGLAGLVWSADPGLTGDVVKAVIVDSAHESGAAIADTRSYVPAAERRTYYLANAKAAVDKAGANVPVTGVALDQLAATLAAGGPALVLTAAISPAYASNQNVTWSSSNPASATVSGSGASAAISPVAPGTAVITVATQDGGKTASCAVTVFPGVVVSVFPRALFVGDAAPLQASVIGLDDGAVTWSASHGSISAAAGAAATYTAPGAVPPGDGRDTVTATSVQMPAASGGASILIRSMGWAGFDGNANTDPQLLGFASAYGSAASADLDKYDIDGDGIVGDEDLATLYRALGW
jgi:hypothetical protein